MSNHDSTLEQRHAPIDMPADVFRLLGHRLIDDVADLLSGLRNRPVTTGESPAQIRQLLRAGEPLPETGTDSADLLNWITRLLFDHSLFNGHPRFLAYITASAAPLGILGELLASAVNPNVGGWKLAPMATEIEAQTVRWIAQLLNYPDECGGILVSGGNMANFVGFLAARAAKGGPLIRTHGFQEERSGRLRVYASRETHTWIQKASDLFGLGTDSIRWIGTDAVLRIDTRELRRQIESDQASGDRPFLVVGSAGTVSTGAIDPLPELAAICREFNLWFHVDGAYAGFAAAVPETPDDIRGIALADSVAVDPHKWLYAPLEAGCALVRNAAALIDAFSYHPPYYHLEEDGINYFDCGPQNSRGFRALKVWLTLKQVGREGYVRMIRDDIALAKELFRTVASHPELQVVTQSLSITTFRYVPAGLRRQVGTPPIEEYLDELNRELLARLEKSGEAYLSNAVVDGRFLLRACVVNFRTSLADVQAIPEIVVRLGRELDLAMRPKESAFQ